MCCNCRSAEEDLTVQISNEMKARGEIMYQNLLRRRREAEEEKKRELQHWTEFEYAWVAVYPATVFNVEEPEKRPVTGLRLAEIETQEGYMPHLFLNLDEVRKAYPDAIGYTNILSMIRYRCT